MVSHICLLVELGPICNSMAASLSLKSCEDHSLLKSYNGSRSMEKHLQVWAHLTRIFQDIGKVHITATLVLIKVLLLLTTMMKVVWSAFEKIQQT